MVKNSLAEQSRREKINQQKAKIAIKRTSLMIDELELKKEEEKEFELTPEEQAEYDKLKVFFKNDTYPVESIKEALKNENDVKGIRKDYLTAIKVQKERQQIKDSLSSDSLGIMLFASSAPVILIGVMLLDSIKVAGIGVIVAGVAMSIPVLINEVTKKRKAKKRLKQINETLDELSEEIHEKSTKTDDICSKYGIPLNCLDRDKYMERLLQKAIEYEAYNKKQSEYEKMVIANGTKELSEQIAKNLQFFSGVNIECEHEFNDAMKLIEDQFATTGAFFKIEDKQL